MYSNKLWNVYLVLYIKYYMFHVKHYLLSLYQKHNYKITIQKN